MAPADPLAGTLRATDPDRYLSVLYAPQEKRADLFALYAFNAEIAAIRDRIREPLPGEVRIQWWRDMIAAGSDATGNPVADRLISAIARNGLPRRAFDNYLDARIFDLYDDQMPGRTELEGYLGETASTLIQFAGMILDRPAAAANADAAGHAGCAQGIAGLLRLLPRQRARGQCFLPSDVLAAAGTTAEKFVRREDEAAARRAVGAMAALARDHWRLFLARAADIPPGLRPAFLPAGLSPLYLARIEAGDALERPAEVAAWRRHLVMLNGAMRGWS